MGLRRQFWRCSIVLIVGWLLLIEAALADRHRSRSLILEVAQTLNSASAAQSNADTAPTTESKALFSSTLQEGYKGDEVKQLQRLLRQAGYSVSIDGDFGPTTEAAVKQLQRELNQPVDGVVGPQTWLLLRPPQTDWGESRAYLALSIATAPRFTEMTPIPQELPPSPIWLVVMPMIPAVGGSLIYLQNHLQGQR